MDEILTRISLFLLTNLTEGLLIRYALNAVCHYANISKELDHQVQKNRLSYVLDSSSVSFSVSTFQLTMSLTRANKLSALVASIKCPTAKGRLSGFTVARCYKIIKLHYYHIFEMFLYLNQEYNHLYRITYTICA